MPFVLWKVKRNVCTDDATKIGVVDIVEMGGRFSPARVEVSGPRHVTTARNPSGELSNLKTFANVDKYDSVSQFWVIFLFDCYHSTCGSHH